MLLVAIRHVNFPPNTANQAHQDLKKSSLELLAGVNVLLSYMLLLLWSVRSIFVGISLFLSQLSLRTISSYDTLLQLKITRTLKTKLKGIPTRTIRYIWTVAGRFS